MSFNELKHLLSKLSYKPGCEFSTTISDYKITIMFSSHAMDSTRPKQWINVLNPLVITESALANMTEIQVLAKVQELIKFFEFHELKEWFRYKGELVNKCH